MTMDNRAPQIAECATCHPTGVSLWERYREFLLSRETILVLLNALLLLAGFSTSVAGAPQVGRWLYRASALIGGGAAVRLCRQGPDHPS